MHGFFNDLKYAARGFRRRPGFFLAIVATLGLGIGANTAIFTLLDALLLRPLPYESPEQLVHVWQTVQRDTLENREFSYPDYLDVRDRARSFESFAAYQTRSVLLTASDGRRTLSEIATASYFDVLGVEPLLGRTFADDPAIATNQVVLSFDLWQSALGGDEAAVGQSFEVDGASRVVAGVMPRGFRGLTRGVELWTSMAAVPQPVLEGRNRRWHRVVGRLHEGTTPELAGLEVKRLFSTIQEENRESNSSYGTQVVSVAEDLFGDLRRPLALLLGAVAFVLLIACSNVANLLLMRATGRRREGALRTALGASRTSMARQYLAETLILAMAGGALAVLVATWGVELLVALNPIPIPDFVTLGLELPVLLANFGLAVLVALALAGLESWQNRSTKLATRLRAGDRAGNDGRLSQRLLVVTQMALAVVLLIGAGLLTKSLQAQRGAEAGFDAQDLTFFRVGMPGERSLDEARSLSARLRDEIGQMPGVEGVALGRYTPLDGNESGIVIRIEGQEPPADSRYDGIRVHRQAAAPGYFRNLGIDLLSGRDFGSQDTADSLPVAIVDESLARLVGDNPLGQRLQYRDRMLTIIGVVRDVRHRNLVAAGGVPEDPDLYFAFEQTTYSDFAIAVRSPLALETLVGPLRHRVEELDSQAVAYAFSNSSERFASQVASPRFSTVLLGLFAGLALVLAALGLASVMGYEVVSRQREIGIRMALGARAKSVLRMILLEGLGIILVGAGLGLVLALLLTRLLETQLYEVAPLDVAAFSGMTLLLIVVALVASLVPALRASRVDPIVSLRHD